MMKKVYIISNDGMDWSQIKHVCGSEETARKRFKELKIELLQACLAAIMFEINEYINNVGIYEKYADEKDVYLQFCLECIEKTIKTLTECTFEQRVRVMVDQPVCTIYDVEE